MCLSINIMIQDDKVTMAQYAVDNDLTDTEGWRGLRKLARKNEMRKRLINQAKLRSYRHSTKYMYGYRIPRDYAEAVAFDLENGNDELYSESTVDITPQDRGWSERDHCDRLRCLSNIL